VTVLPEAVKEANAVVAPTAAGILTAPVPAVSVNAWAPLMVVEKLIGAPPPAEVLITDAPVITTGPVIVTEPLVVVVILLPRLIALETAVPV
jgi:hypothetical protein